MRIKGLLVSSLVVTAMCVPMSFAQSDNSTPSATNHPGTIQQRKQNQQERIANGVKSGQHTPGETAKLERKEANLNKEERQMRSADAGKLTAADRAKLNRQQNELSKQIYNKKHNARKGY